MNVRDLMTELEVLREEYGDELEVQLWEQPSWPLAFDIDEVEVVESEEKKPVAFLVEGSHIGYAPRLDEE